MTSSGQTVWPAEKRIPYSCSARRDLPIYVFWSDLLLVAESVAEYVANSTPSATSSSGRTVCPIGKWALYSWSARRDLPIYVFWSDLLLVAESVAEYVTNSTPSATSSSGRTVCPIGKWVLYSWSARRDLPIYVFWSDLLLVAESVAEYVANLTDIKIYKG